MPSLTEAVVRWCKKIYYENYRNIYKKTCAMENFLQHLL